MSDIQILRAHYQDDDAVQWCFERHQTATPGKVRVARVYGVHHPTYDYYVFEESSRRWVMFWQELRGIGHAHVNTIETALRKWQIDTGCKPYVHGSAPARWF